MKKLITLILAATLALPALGQSYGASHARTQRYDRTSTEHYFGLRLGMNVASVGSDEVFLDYTARTGLNLGFVYGVQLTNTAPVWLELGLSYSEKGGLNSGKGENIKMRMTYLEVPLVCKYSFEVSDDFYVQPFVGGYLSVGVAGRIKDYNNRVASSTYDTFNRFDGGLRFGCGAEYQMLYAELGMAFGLADISKDDFSSATTQNFFINVGVNF